MANAMANPSPVTGGFYEQVGPTVPVRALARLVLRWGGRVEQAMPRVTSDAAW